MTTRGILLAILFASASVAQQPDNTERNKRDRDGTTMTAEKQGNSKEDTEMVARIRRAVTQDDTLSTASHNVKIVVNAGRVWLRGPVPTEEEKDRVISHARSIAGEQNVTNLLEVKKGNK